MATTSYTITSAPGYIIITDAAGTDTDRQLNIPVSGITIHARYDFKREREEVSIYWESGNWVKTQDYLSLYYTEVAVPALASNAALIALLRSLVASASLGGGGSGDEAFLVGKSAEATLEDFTVAFLAPTTLTLANFPYGIVGISATDIETVRQINDVTGDVVAEYKRADTPMVVAAGVLTVTGAAFTAGDYFVIMTNIPRATLEASQTDIESGFYVGKSLGTQTDFGVTFLAPTTLTLSAYPNNIAAFTNSDIEWVRQINLGGQVVATYRRDEATITLAANVLTIAGAVFGATDNFVVMTNVPRFAEKAVNLELDSGCLIGKSAEGIDGDFSAVFLAPTTLTLSGYPAGVTTISASDIEWVRHIDDVTGDVVETFRRDQSGMSVAADVLTVDDGAFTAADYFVIQTNIPRPASAGGSGVGGGESTYSNLQGDFVATINNATKTITITGLSWTLTAESIEKIRLIDTSDIGSTLNILDVAVVGGVITLANVDDFVTGDVVAVYLTGADKNRDAALDVKKVIDQAPDYAHFTDPQPLVADEDLGDNWGNWTDQGTEIPCASYNTLFLYVSVTLADSTLPYMQVLGKHESAGAEEYDLVDFAVVDWTGETTNFLKVYEVPINHGMPYVQVQTKTGIDGDVTTTSTTTAGHTNGIISITYTLGYK